MNSHQDWNEVVFHKPKTAADRKATFDKPHFEASPQMKFAEETEELHHDTVPLSLAKTIQQARLAKYPSQKAFAQALNVKVDVVNSYENGKAIPDNGTLQKMRRLLKVKLDVKA